MCICIVRPKDVILTKAVLKSCFKNNPHGAGFAIPSDDGKRVIIKKGFFHFREFWTAFRDAQNKKRPMLIHFRVATSGYVDRTNCHPWRINKTHALIHNGDLQYKLGVNAPECSDTGLYVRHILQPSFRKNPEIWKIPAYKWLVEHSIGFKNKIVILNNKGEFVIFNEKEGEWAHNVWFSNDTYKKDRKNIGSIREVFIEDGVQGEKIIKIKKDGKTEIYRHVSHPLTIEEQDEKIIKFAEKQTGVPLAKEKEKSYREAGLEFMQELHGVDPSTLL